MVLNLDLVSEHSFKYSDELDRWGIETQTFGSLQSPKFTKSLILFTQMDCLGFRDKIVFIKPPWTLADLLQLLDK